MTRQVKLLVNDAPIPLDYFVEAFVDHTVGGMIASLEGTGEIENLELSIEGGIVTIILNGANVPANPHRGYPPRTTPAVELKKMRRQR